MVEIQVQTKVLKPNTELIIMARKNWINIDKYEAFALNLPQNESKSLNQTLNQYKTQSNQEKNNNTS